METDLIQRSCNNCDHFPCLKTTCGEVCEQHIFEHEKIIAAIEKIKREGYMEFEGMR